VLSIDREGQFARCLGKQRIAKRSGAFDGFLAAARLQRTGGVIETGGLDSIDFDAGGAFRQCQGAAGYERVEKLFSFENHIKKLVTIFNEV